MGIIRASASYSVKITDFEGPLDLLLHLIRESKLDIKTIPLASVTSQYVEFLSQLDQLDLNLASEFIEVGATLLDIKSRQILPRVKPEDEEDLEEAEARLRAQLEEYKLLKEASEQLRAHENLNRFYKDPAPIKEIIRYSLDNLEVNALVEAFSRIMHRVQKESEPIRETQIRMDRFTVAEKMDDIRARLQAGEKIYFSTLFDTDFTKGEVISSFLAVLELLKSGEIIAIQGEKFGDIELQATATGGDNGATITSIEGQVTDIGELYEEFYTVVDGVED